MGPRIAMDEEERKLHVNNNDDGMGMVAAARNQREEDDEDCEDDDDAEMTKGSTATTRNNSSEMGDGEADKLQQNRRSHADNFQFGNYTRYLVMFLTTLCLSLSMSNALALNFTVICMFKPTTDDKEEELDGNISFTAATADNPNGLQNQHEPIPMFNSAEQALLFSAVPLGTLLGTLPITPLTSRFGMRWTFTIYGLISGAATLLTPLSAQLDFGLLLIMRVLQGIAVSICFPASGSIIEDWCPLRSAGTFIALLSCHIQFGPILTMPLAGELCESSWGWPAVYYLQSFLTALVFGAFFAFYRDSPRFHRNVSRKELCRIERGKPPLSAGPERHQVPYAAMLRDPAVWGVFLCSMGSTFGFHVFMQYGPVYLNQTIKFDVARTGFAMALPCLLSALAKFIVGPASDHMRCVTERCRVLLFATVSQFLMAFCFIALALLPADSPRLLIQGFFTSVTVVSGLNCAGVGKSTQLISRQFAHVVTSFSVFLCSITIIVIPVMVSALAPDNRPEQWSRIFLVVSVVVIFCVLFFDWTAEASPRPWTFTRKDVLQKKRESRQSIQKAVTSLGQRKEEKKSSSPLLLIVAPRQQNEEREKKQQHPIVSSIQGH